MGLNFTNALGAIGYVSERVPDAPHRPFSLNGGTYARILNLDDRSAHNVSRFLFYDEPWQSLQGAETVVESENFRKFLLLTNPLYS